MQIYFTNKSTKITDDEVYQIAIACDWQLRHHAIQAWKVMPSSVRYLGEGVPSDPNTAVIGFFDDADQAGDLGWHTEGPGGVKYGRVFVGPVLQAGGNALTDALSVCSVASHEALEIVFDPACNRWAYDGSNTLYAWESCDPVEGDSYPLVIPSQATVGGSTTGQIRVTVSNFVTPDWFDSQAPAGTRFDYLGLCTAPFEVRSTGYAVTMTAGTVSQVFGEEYPEWRKETKKSELSRTSRRKQESHRSLEGELRLLRDHL